MATTPQTSSTDRPGKRRAPMSCDRCKNRKTKCVDPVPGPCQFCASIGAPCQVDPSRRRQRPYYHVSEEEFRYMTKALEHFLPDVELNLQSLKGIVTSFGEGNSAAAKGGQLQRHDSPRPRQQPTPTVELGSPTASPANGSGDVRPNKSSTSTPASHESIVTIEEIDDLHGEMGWLTVDSKGNYRHVGMEGSYGFNAAVRSLKSRRLSEVAVKTDLVAPLTAAPPLPPQTPEILTGPRQIYLPRRDLCNRCVARFFRDVHSMYWFFSAESFYATLDRIYSGDAGAATSSMLCSLYSILTLTCESEARSDGIEVGDGSSMRYLSLAKSLAATLYDEADVDCVRALCLLGLALQSSMFANTAYIYVGSAASIAYTLGLHLQKTSKTKECLQRQVDLRIFSTLYLLDHDVALCYGNPTAISEDNAIEPLELLSEQILSPGSNMPLYYLSVSCKLTHLKRQIGRLLYTKTNSSPPGGVSISAVSDAIASLHAWHASMPPHLRDAAQAPSYHNRSVAVLHLRYYSALVFATRPFLLYSVLRAAELKSSPKRAHFEEFGALCADAARRSMSLLVYMRDAGLLTSLVTHDTACLLENLQVLLLSYARAEQGDGWRETLQQAADAVRECLHILQGMEQVLWTKHALVEVMAQLDENGMLNGDSGFSPSGVDAVGHYFLDIGPQQDLFPGIMDAYLPDLQDACFTIPEATPGIVTGTGDL